MPNLTMTSSPPAANSLSDVCDAVRWATCGECQQVPGLPCVMHRVTGAAGCHVARFAHAYRLELISGPELVAALAVPPAFTNSTVIYAEPDLLTVKAGGPRCRLDHATVIYEDGAR